MTRARHVDALDGHVAHAQGSPFRLLPRRPCRPPARELVTPSRVAEFEKLRIVGGARIGRSLLHV